MLFPRPYEFWLDLERKEGCAKQGALLVDFFIFSLEAILLFIGRSSFRYDLATFYLLGVVLATDVHLGASLPTRSTSPLISVAEKRL